jgi:hypothetical protein
VGEENIRIGKNEPLAEKPKTEHDTGEPNAGNRESPYRVARLYAYVAAHHGRPPCSYFASILHVRDRRQLSFSNVDLAASLFS